MFIESNHPCSTVKSPCSTAARPRINIARARIWFCENFLPNICHMKAAVKIILVWPLMNTAQFWLVPILRFYQPKKSNTWFLGACWIISGWRDSWPTNLYGQNGKSIMKKKQKNMAAWGNHCAIKCKTWMCLRCPANKITKYPLWILQTVGVFPNFLLEKKRDHLKHSHEFQDSITVWQHIYWKNLETTSRMCATRCPSE